jgi:hypothetical protein
MSDVLSIAAARKHLRVSSSTTDQELQDLIAAAQARVEDFLGRELVGETGWPTAEEVPAAIGHAVKLAVSDFFVNREAPKLTDEQLRPIIGRHQRLSIG